MLFHRAINKYGKENFEWTILEENIKTIEELNDLESYYIKLFDSTNKDKGYNLRINGENKFVNDEVKRKIGNAQKGEKNHMYGKTGALNKTSKKVINLNTNVIYGSSMECARELNLSNSHISSVCRGDRGSTGGYVFRYLDENNNIIEPKNKINIKNKQVMCLETKEIFSSVADAERKYFGHRNGTISTACKIGRISAGYHWKFI